jgi:hypothetical protein
MRSQHLAFDLKNAAAGEISLLKVQFIHHDCLHENNRVLLCLMR